MIKDSDIESLFREEASKLGLPVVYPNQSSEVQKPFLVLNIKPTSRIDGTLAQTKPVSRGIVTFTYVGDEGIGSTTANRKAEEIAAAFMSGRILTAPSGSVRITKPPFIADGYAVNSSWRKAVVLDYKAGR